MEQYGIVLSQRLVDAPGGWCWLGSDGCCTGEKFGYRFNSEVWYPCISTNVVVVVGLGIGRAGVAGGNMGWRSEARRLEWMPRMAVGSAGGRLPCRNLN